jgi:hypothetical protein
MSFRPLPGAVRPRKAQMLNAAGVSRTAHQERRRAALATPDVNGIQMDWRPD